MLSILKLVNWQKFFIFKRWQKTRYIYQIHDQFFRENRHPLMINILFLFSTQV